MIPLGVRIPVSQQVSQGMAADFWNSHIFPVHFALASLPSFLCCWIWDVLPLMVPIPQIPTFLSC